MANYLGTYADTYGPYMGAGAVTYTGIDVVRLEGQSNKTGSGFLFLLGQAPLIRLPYDLQREFPAAYIFNVATGQLQHLQASVNSQGFSPALNGYPDSFGLELPLAQYWSVRYPNRILAILKPRGGNGQQISYFRKTDGNGADNRFYDAANTCWIPGEQAILALGASLGIPVTEKAFFWIQGETEPSDSPATYGAQLTDYLDNDMAPYTGRAKGGRIGIAPCINRRDLDAAKNGYVAAHSDSFTWGPDYGTHIGPVTLANGSQIVDDVHHTARYILGNGGVLIPEAAGWQPVSDHYLYHIRADNPAHTTGRLVDEGEFLNDFVAYDANSTVTISASSLPGHRSFKAGPGAVTRFVTQSVQRAPGRERTMLFVLKQPPTSVPQYIWDNGNFSAVPGYAQGLVTVGGAYVGTGDASNACVLAATFARTATTDQDEMGLCTVYFNGAQVAQHSCVLKQLDGPAGATAVIGLFAPFDPGVSSDYAMKAGAELWEMSAWVGISQQRLAAETNKVRNYYGLDFTPVPTTPKGYQATYTDTVPADA